MSPHEREDADDPQVDTDPGESEPADTDSVESGPARADSRDGRTVDRRTVLAASGTLLAGPALGSLPTGPARADTAVAGPERTPGDPASLTVATRNLSLGVRLARLFDVRSTDELRGTAGTLLERVREHPYGARLDAVAAEVETTGPAVLAVQEAARIRERPTGAGSDEWTTVVDLRERIESSLAAAGLEYELAASATTTDIEVPADTDDGRRDVRLTDRVALLVRSDVEWRDPDAGRFDAQFGLPFAGDIALERGFCTATVTAGSRPVTAVSTHLESVSASVRRRQAEELLDRLPTDGAVALAGDFNSGPGTETASYDLLRESFTDPWDTLRPDADGPTCCQRQRLTNDESLLEGRVDAVLVRGGLHPAAVERVGHRPEDRVTVTRGDERVTVWPSDHAGVVATFEAAPPAPTASASPTPGQGTTRSGGGTAAVRDTGRADGDVSSTAGRATTGDGEPTGTDAGAPNDSGGGSSNGLGPGPGVASVLGGAALATLALLRGRSDSAPDDDRRD